MSRLGDRASNNVSSFRIWKKLYDPKSTNTDPKDPTRVVYTPFDAESIQKQQMARRMDRKVIKLETAYGSERQTIIVKRNQELIVRDLMEEVQRVYKIPVEEQVIFHKGTNLCDFMNIKLEDLGIENNHTIRVTRDPELPNRSPRAKPQLLPGSVGVGNIQQQQPNANSLDAVSYLKEIAPQRVPDPTPFQVQIYNQQIGNLNQNKTQVVNDVLKLYVALGSEREYVLVHGKKPITIKDLKMALHRSFKIAPEQQCIVFKGYNLHDYLDEAPLDAFGLENNSPVSLWPKGSNNQPDLRLPRGTTPPPPDMFSPRNPGIPGSLSPRRPDGLTSEVLKLEVQHGSDRHPLILKGANKTLTVLDLQNELEKMTAVPVKDQRLFFRSQELHLTPFKTLKDCDLENNNVVKLVGDPAKLRYSNYFGKLNVSGFKPDPSLLNQQYNPSFSQQNNQMQQPIYNPQMNNQQQMYNMQMNNQQPMYNMQMNNQQPMVYQQSMYTPQMNNQQANFAQQNNFGKLNYAPQGF